MKRQEFEITVGSMPSHKNRCPRNGCGRELETVMLDSGVMLERCAERHYEAKTVTGESRLAWHEAVNTVRIERR